jgi:hypothetical protein
MDTNKTTNKTTTSKSASVPRTDAPNAFSEMAEMSAMQSQEAYKKMSAASTETADLIKNSSATALKGLQDGRRFRPSSPPPRIF